ncbi:MAG: histidine kinase [Bacteroidota bacterium]
MPSVSPPSRALLRRLRLPAAMVVVGAASGVLVAWLEDKDLGQSMAYGVLYGCVMWTSLLVARRWLYRRVPLRSWQHAALHIAALTTTATATFLLIYGLDALLCALFEPDRALDGEGPRLVSVAIVAGLFAVLVSTLMYAFDFYRQLRNAEQAALTSELKALRAQINPHFLFNTLNAIAALVRTRPREAEGVTEQLAELFRYTLRASKQPTVTLADEVEAARLYASIEETRFGDRLVVLVEVPPSLLGAQVPSLMLQPLVENAVKHGCARTEEACAVQVRAERAGDAVHLTVRDTGPGFATTDPAVVFGRGTGLANVRDRLGLLFGEAATLTLLPDGVALRFPFRTAVAEPHPAGRPVWERPSAEG